MPQTNRSWGPSSLLRDYFVKAFRPAAVERLSFSHLTGYDQAVASFVNFAGDSVRLADVTDDLLARFVRDCDLRGRSAMQRRRLAGFVRQVILAWNPDAVRKPRQQIETLPPAKRITVRGYFEKVYAVESMVGCRAMSIETTLLSLRALSEFVGHEVELSEQSDRLAADFFRYLRETGLTEATVNRYRRTWFAVWRHAFDRDLVRRPPRVKRLREVHDPPDSWSRGEMRALVNAALGYRKTELYGEVRCNLWWHAILLVTYYTALRYSSLIAIRREDVDLKTGTLHVSGSNMKNRQGQVFKLGADAVSAVELIWLPPRLLLFASDQSKWTIIKHFGELLVAAGIPPGRRKRLSKFHKLRRSVATEIAALAGPAAASSLLGHSSAYVTARYLDPSRLPGHDVTKILAPLAAS